jgi:hypothetical protein
MEPPMVQKVNVSVILKRGSTASTCVRLKTSEEGTPEWGISTGRRHTWKVAQDNGKATKVV